MTCSERCYAGVTQKKSSSSSPRPPRHPPFLLGRARKQPSGDESMMILLYPSNVCLSLLRKINISYLSSVSFDSLLQREVQWGVPSPGRSHVNACLCVDEHLRHLTAVDLGRSVERRHSALWNHPSMQYTHIHVEATFVRV